MAESDSEAKGCCKSYTCACREFVCRFKDYCCIFVLVIRTRWIASTLLVLFTIALCVAFHFIEDPDWNICVVPYFFSLAACAFVSAFCKRGHYDGDRISDLGGLGGVVVPQMSRRSTENVGFEEVIETEASPLLQGQSRNGTTKEPLFYAVSRPLSEDPEQVFEPSPVRIENREVVVFRRRNSQVIVQADVHEPIPEPPSPSTVSPEPQVSSTASGSDAQNLTTPDSGVALQSTGQSTTSGSDGPVLRPPPPDPGRPGPPQEDLDPQQLNRLLGLQNAEFLQQPPGPQEECHGPEQPRLNEQRPDPDYLDPNQPEFYIAENPELPEQPPESPELQNLEQPAMAECSEEPRQDAENPEVSTNTSDA